MAGFAAWCGADVENFLVGLGLECDWRDEAGGVLQVDYAIFEIWAVCERLFVAGKPKAIGCPADWAGECLVAFECVNPNGKLGSACKVSLGDGGNDLFGAL